MGTNRRYSEGAIFRPHRPEGDPLAITRGVHRAWVWAAAVNDSAPA